MQIAHAGEDKQLAAYVVLKEAKTKKELRAALKRRLPFYMIPTYFKVMDKCVLRQLSASDCALLLQAANIARQRQM